MCLQTEIRKIPERGLHRSRSLGICLIIREAKIMRAWTLEELRELDLPAPAWIVSDRQDPRPVIIISATARRPEAEEIVIWVTEKARYANARTENIQSGRISFFPDRPGV